MLQQRQMTLIAAVASAMLSAGCATTSPGVAYYDMAETARPKDGLDDVFALDQAVLKIEFSDVPPPAAKANPGAELGKSSAASLIGKLQAKFTVEIVEDGRRIGFNGTNNLYKTTTINVTKRDNTELVQSVGATTTENLKNSITKIGSMLAAFATVARTDNTSPCKYLNLNAKIDSGNERQLKSWAPKDSCVTYRLEKAPADAIEFKDIPWGQEVGTFYYAACRTLVVDIKGEGREIQTLTFKVPDPYFVQAVRIPFKGSIKKHSTCGVSTVTEGQASPTASIEALTELITQINAIKEANDGK
ncbi:hypothetical protein ACIGHN_27950 [Acidovorax sp. NPDC077693]|uniref:hypothetical protein n=1 Tax=unclassified Acidovorax TaxID=2684926 RepID=UPI0037C7E17C